MSKLRIRGFLLASLALAACSTATLEQVEEVGDTQEGNPGLERGEYDLDDDLCWQSAKPPPGAPVDDATLRASHDACMREHGWAAGDGQ